LADQINRLTLRSADGREETLRTTFNHPFLRADAGGGDQRVLMEPAGDWTAAGRLQPGDLVRSAAGEALRVVAIAADNDPARVYSLEVAGLYSFAAGRESVWAHNASVRETLRIVVLTVLAACGPATGASKRPPDITRIPNQRQERINKAMEKDRRSTAEKKQK
jgi:hypothetical protein